MIRLKYSDNFENIFRMSSIHWKLCCRCNKNESTKSKFNIQTYGLTND